MRVVLSERIINSKHSILMRREEQLGYLAPEIEVNEVVVESGIATTGGGNLENPEFDEEI